MIIEGTSRGGDHGAGRGMDEEARMFAEAFGRVAALILADFDWEIAEKHPKPGWLLCCQAAVAPEVPSQYAPGDHRSQLCHAMGRV
jgi:hypothetical protein